MHCLTVLKILGAVAVFIKPINCVDVDQAIEGTIRGRAGKAITLVCDLRDTFGVDNIWFSNSDYYLSLGDSIEPSTPSVLVNRLSIRCNAIRESCSLTIANLMEADNRIYRCGVVTATGRRVMASAYLFVLVPPTDTSPTCNIYDDSSILINPHLVRVGDTVLFSCIITGGNPKPSVYVAREAEAISVTAMASFSYSYTLSKNDQGLSFWCIMNHTALPRPRMCLLLTLATTTTKQPTTLNPTSTKMSSTATLSESSGYTKTKITQPSSVSVDKSDTVFMVIVILTVLLLVLIAIVGGFLIWHLLRKRNQKQPIPTKPDYDVNVNRECSIAADYAVLNAQDSIDKDIELKSPSLSPNEKLLVEYQTSHGCNTEQQDAFPIYAKPDKKINVTDTADRKSQLGQYDNLSHTPDDTSRDDTKQDGLMYADLDLPVSSSSEPPRKPLDATVYAHILRI